MIPRKKWATYTAHEKELMKTAVTHAHPDEYFTVEYAAIMAKQQNRKAVIRQVW